MLKLAQVGIALVALGGVLTMIGLFPSITGLEASPGIGILQIMVILAGFSILIFGAYLFVQSAYYPGVKHNLAQQIALRLSMTGIIVAAASGLADVLGFGSHPLGVEGQHPYFGMYKAAGVLGGFLVASMGVVVFALMGPSDSPTDEPPENGTEPEQPDKLL